MYANQGSGKGAFPDAEWNDFGMTVRGFNMPYSPPRDFEEGEGVIARARTRGRALNVPDLAG